MENAKGIFTKEDVMNGVKWFNSKNPHKFSNKDITISKHKTGYGIIFRNGCEKKLGAAHGRIEFGIVRPGIIAFRSSADGYQFCSKGNTKSIAFRNPKGKDVFSVLEEYIGDYDLEYDNTFGLCYINLDKRG